MKIFLACLCLLLVSYSAWVTVAGRPGPPEFTDLLGQKASPDGLIVASYVLQNYEPMGGHAYGLTLSGKQESPLKAEPILVEGEDDKDVQYNWISNNQLDIRLPCGWWGRLTNHYQLKGTSRIMNIVYLPPPSECPRENSGSTALPK